MTLYLIDYSDYDGDEFDAVIEADDPREAIIIWRGWAKGQTSLDGVAVQDVWTWQLPEPKGSPGFRNWTIPDRSWMTDGLLVEDL